MLHVLRRQQRRDGHAGLHRQKTNGILKQKKFPSFSRQFWMNPSFGGQNKTKTLCKASFVDGSDRVLKIFYRSNKTLKLELIISINGDCSMHGPIYINWKYQPILTGHDKVRILISKFMSFASSSDEMGEQTNVRKLNTTNLMWSKQKVLSPATQAVHGAIFCLITFFWSAGWS